MILGLPARSSSERDKERVRWPSKAADGWKPLCTQVNCLWGQGLTQSSRCVYMPLSLQSECAECCYIVVVVVFSQEILLVVFFSFSGLYKVCLYSINTLALRLVIKLMNQCNTDFFRYDFLERYAKKLLSSARIYTNTEHTRRLYIHILVFICYCFRLRLFMSDHFRIAALNLSHVTWCTLHQWG